MVIWVLLASCASKVERDYDTDYDFSKLRTYAKAHKDPDDKMGTQKTLVKKRIQKFAKQTLDSKGFALTEAENADFLVDFTYKSEDVIVPAAIQPSVAFGYGPRYYGGGYGVGVGYNYGAYQREEIETLILDIWDAKTKEHIWTAKVETDLVEKDVDKTEENFQKAIESLLEEFPPIKLQ